MDLKNHNSTINTDEEETNDNAASNDSKENNFRAPTKKPILPEEMSEESQATNHTATNSGTEYSGNNHNESMSQRADLLSDEESLANATPNDSNNHDTTFEEPLLPHEHNQSTEYGSQEVLTTVSTYVTVGLSSYFGQNDGYLDITDQNIP